MAQDMERFITAASVRLPGALVDAMQLELFALMDEFFKDTNVWLEDIDLRIPGNDPPGSIYYIMPSGPAVIDKLMWAFSLSENESARGSAIAAAMPVPGELLLAYQPSSPVTYRVTVACTVQDPTQKDGFVVFPAWVLAKYRNGLLDGLLGRMMTQPNKPFTNTQLSVYHTRKFNNTKAAAKVDMMRANTFRRQAWVFPRMVGGSQKGRGSGVYIQPQ